ncbi:MAG: glycoside hydrolase family 65 protein [Oscillospiraceae bacterium]|jgi:kojibiose phosphorylase/nigerose phosphorylase|nr:glycoside hydrolase family 65 protein [Oscillospiraceae bacterium]
MDIWTFTQDGYREEDIVTNGNRFLVGNGYMGFRGTMDEWGRRQMAAVCLAGVYDQNGDRWREPVNAPNGLFARLTVNGADMALGAEKPLEHRQTIDFRRGVHKRDTLFEPVRIQSERFASMAEPHLLRSRLTLTFRQDAEAELLCGIDTDLWDINGPHLFDYTYKTSPFLLTEARTGELNIPVAAAQNASADFPCEETREAAETGVFRRLRFNAAAGQTYTITLAACVFTGLDGPNPGERAQALCGQTRGFAEDLTAHEAAWEAVWSASAVELHGGGGEAARSLNASLYHLHSIAPRHAQSLSVPARGLSGQTYKGAVFWDSEIFLFPVFVHTEPELAKTLLRYRIDTLPGALRKAAEYGYRGAFYPWESQEGGAEGCTDYNVTDVFTHRPVRTYFRDKQIHISGDIAYALWKYYEITGDDSLMREGGAEVILQCARFYLSRAHRRADCDKTELLDVIGPDEYHERVNNNAFTNQMAAHCMSCAIALADADTDFARALIQKLDYDADLALLREIEPKLRPVFAEGALIEQFDGYFSLEDASLAAVRSRVLDEREYWGTNHGVAAHTQIIKQADVVALTALFPSLFSDQTVERNWRYYEPRTEHGSSLSACMYALTACRFRRPDLAWEHFVKTASIDLSGGGKHWAGEIYIGGTHPAANGGAWMIAALGFAGLSVRNGEITLNPCLPEQIETLRFPVCARGKRVTVTVTRQGWTLE